MKKNSEKFPKLLQKVKKILGGTGFLLNSSKIQNITEKLADEIEQAPKVAIIGETGVGKSSTLNTLFNAGAPIHDIEPCTSEPLEYIVVTEIEGKHGPIRVFDMPGVGQDLESDKQFYKEYTKILPECDVALWILDANVRTLSQMQYSLKTVTEAMSGLNKLVIGINKVDRIEPGRWNFKSNIPSKVQKENIKRRVEYVESRLKVFLSTSKIPQVVPYSAKQHYQLGKLIDAIMNACPKNRRWVLHDRVELAKYEDMVDPRVLEKLKKYQKDGRNK